MLYKIVTEINRIHRNKARKRANYNNT